MTIREDNERQKVHLRKNLEEAKRFILYASPDALSVGNRLYFCCCLCFGPMIGSGVSIVGACAVFYGFWHLFRRNVSFSGQRPILICIAAFAFYFASELIASLVRPGGNNLTEVLENLTFLGLMPMFAAICADRETLLQSVEKAAAGSALASFALYQLLAGGPFDRAELLTGNAGVMSILASILLTINCLAMWRRRGASEWLYVLGALFSAALVLDAATRAMFPAILLAPLLTFWMVNKKQRWNISLRNIAIVLIVLLAAGLTSYKLLQLRVELIYTDIMAYESNNLDTSIGRRVVLWKIGGAAFLENPLTGQGPGNAVALIAKETKKQIGIQLEYSHFHNAVINELARAGLLGLSGLILMFAAPFWVCLKAEKDEIGQAGFAFLAGVQATYLLSGLTGIMLGHDILDFTYVGAVVFALYLVFSPRQREPASLNVDIWAV